MVGLSFVPGALMLMAPWPGLSLAPGALVLTAPIGERCVKRRRLGQPAASESAAARSSAAGQPSAEAVLGRAAVSGEPEWQAAATQHGRQWRRRVYRALNAGNCRHGRPAASGNAAAVSGGQTRREPTQRRTGASSDAACTVQ